MAGALPGLPLALVGNKGLRIAIPFGPFLSLVPYVLHGPERATPLSRRGLFGYEKLSAAAIVR